MSPHLLATVLFILTILVPAPAPAQDEGCADLVARVSGGVQVNVFERNRTLQQAVFRADSTCIPLLESAFRELEYDLQRAQAAHAMALIGGRAAVDALLRLRDETRSDVLVASIVQAMGSTGSSEDIEFLVEVVMDDRIDSWTREDAVLTLGLLRAREARASLQAVAGTRQAISSEAAHIIPTLDWPPCRSVHSAGLPASDAAILAVLRCITPPGGDAEYCEWDRSRMWRYEAGRWSSTPVAECDPHHIEERDEGFGSFIYDVQVAPDERHARVEVGYVCGRRCGGGHVYTLSRDTEEWTVRSVRKGWVL